MARKLLIVGAGMAAAYLLQELQAQDHDLDITVIGDERDICYNRVLLSTVLAREAAEDDLAMLDKDSTANTRFVTGTRAQRVDLNQRQVHCDQGPPQCFDLLVIATGSTVARPPVACAGIEGVRVFRTLDDTRQLQAMAAAGKAAVVVGGGLLGLEAAHGLNRLGFTTTVAHRNSHLMNRQLDAEGGDQLRRALADMGIDFQLGTTVADLHTEGGTVTGIELDSGKTLDCDLLLFATGIVPDAHLARSAGLVTDRGVIVDEHLRTSAPGIYALGECCQFGRQCFGLVAPIRDQAAVLARELLQRPGAPFRVDDWPTQLKISGIDIYRAGELDDDAEQLLLRDPARGIYRRLVIREDRLIGAVLVGDKRGGTWYAELIHNRRHIAALRPGLMFGRDIAEAGQPAAQAA